jgi:hypothetical protein
VSSTGAYAPGPAPSGTLTAPATTNLFAAVVIFVLFVLAAVVSAGRKDITQGFDEVAHASYVAHIQASGQAWPALGQMRLLDPNTFQFTGAPNYLNHPPLFYDLLAVFGPKLESHPQALLVFRLIDVAAVAIGFAALLGLGLAARLTRVEFYAYAVPLACIPVLVPLAGSVNNDDLAFVGGALALLGAWQLLATNRAVWLALALAGVIVAAFAKLTGLLLAATMVAGVIAYLIWRKRLSWLWAGAAMITFAVAAAPYLIYAAHYGSPTPETPAQIALITDGARAAGWSSLPRKTFPEYLFYFIGAFVADWMPALGPRSSLNYAMLIIPVAAIGCGFAGTAYALRRLLRGGETTLDIIVLTGAIAIAVTFAIHVDFSYGRHLATGWLMDAYPRYYLPLTAIMPLAGLSLYRALGEPRWRNAVLAFLIAGPVIFRIFGAPLG